jgi:hypothetical protein
MRIETSSAGRIDAAQSNRPKHEHYPRRLLMGELERVCLCNSAVAKSIADFRGASTRVDRDLVLLAYLHLFWRRSELVVGRRGIDMTNSCTPLFQPLTLCAYTLNGSHPDRIRNHSGQPTPVRSRKHTMVTPTGHAVCVCHSNSDSALWTTANILAIFTFAYVLVLGTSYTFMSRLNSRGDILELRSMAADLRQPWQAIDAFYRTQASPMVHNIEQWQSGKSLLDKAGQPLSMVEKELARLPTKADGNGERWCFVWRHVKAMRERRKWRNLLLWIKELVDTSENLMCVVHGHLLTRLTADIYCRHYQQYMQTQIPIREQFGCYATTTERTYCFKHRDQSGSRSLVRQTLMESKPRTTKMH